MTPPVKVNESKWRETLEAIQRHKDLKAAAESLETKYSTLYKRAVLLERIGLVHSIKAAQKRVWALTDLGREYLIKSPSWGDEKVKLFRLHANAYTFEILKKPPIWDRQKPKLMIEQGMDVKQLRLNNNTQEFLYFFDTAAKVTTRKIIIYINNIYGKSAEECDTEAYRKLLLVFPKYERKLRKLGVTIRKPSYGVQAANTSHYAREGDELAVRATDANVAIGIRDAVDGKLRVITDRSKGSPELEFVHPAHSRDDADTYERFLSRLIERDPFAELDLLFSRGEGILKVLEKHSNDLARAAYTFSRQSPHETEGWN